MEPQNWQKGDMQEKVEQQQKPEEAAKFMIAEFNALNQDFQRLRTAGINRLNFLVTIATAIFGLVAISMQIGSVETLQLQLFIIGALLLLSIIGLETFRYFINRDIATDYNVRAMARIRHFFADNHPRIEKYLTWRYTDSPTDSPTGFITANSSGLRNITQIIISITISSTIGLVIQSIFNVLFLSLFLGILIGITVFLLLQSYANRQFQAAQSLATDQARFPGQPQDMLPWEYHSKSRS
jgi:hypothetical protein